MAAEDEKINKLQVIDRFNPYFIHRNDNLGVAIISIKFNGANYHKWSRAMHRSLKTKNIIAFLDGTIPKPDIGDATYQEWDQ